MRTENGRAIGLTVAALAAASCLALAACECNNAWRGRGGIGDPCQSLADCEDGLFCSAAGACYEPGDGGTDGDVDVDVDGDGDSDAGDAGCAGGCGPGEVCRAGECVRDLGPCEDDDDCRDDSCCVEARCVPYGSRACGELDEGCTQLVVAGLFQPTIQCEWVGPPEGDPFPAHTQVLGTPAVADFDFDGDEATVAPSIVFNSYDGLDGDSGVATDLDGVLRIIDGRTCEQQFSIGPATNGCNPVAIGDLDADGRPEIVLYMNDAAIEAYGFDPALGAFARLWESHDLAGARQAITRYHAWTGPSIADLDDDGRPEVIAEGTVVDAAGAVLDASAAAASDFGVVADLDLDGVVELATGATIFGWDALGRVWVAEGSAAARGYVAVADFGTFADATTDDRTTLDGVAEVAVVTPGQARVDNLAGRVVFGPIALPASSGGGPPTIGDFDGDGLAELAAAGSDSYTIFDPDCQGVPDAARCPSLRADGILWTRPSQDHSSNITGSSIFDFEGDRRAEAVYADEVFVRVYDGVTGDVVFSQYRSSCTWNENPIVADTDGDFNAELVVPSNESCTIVPSTLGGMAYDTDAAGRILDPLFAGLRCEAGSDCPSGLCDSGFCRCTADAECSGGSAVAGFVCAPPPAGTPGEGGSTCRAAWLGRVHGIRVYNDILDRWASSRTIWNQHAYAVTAISETGVVSRTSEWTQNWTDPDLNNFRQNVQGEVSADAIADATSRGAPWRCEPDGAAALEAAVCNRGTAPIGAGIPVTFYVGDPAACVVVPGCTVRTEVILWPGECATVGCGWAEPPTEAADLTVVADDDGSCVPFVGERECSEGNNRATIQGVRCEAPG
jgi:hypothetical protein